MRIEILGILWQLFQTLFSSFLALFSRIFPELSFPFSLVFSPPFPCPFPRFSPRFFFPLPFIPAFPFPPRIPTFPFLIPNTFFLHFSPFSPLSPLQPHPDPFPCFPALLQPHSRLWNSSPPSPGGPGLIIQAGIPAEPPDRDAPLGPRGPGEFFQLSPFPFQEKNRDFSLCLLQISEGFVWIKKKGNFGVFFEGGVGIVGGWDARKFLFFHGFPWIYLFCPINSGFKW